MSLLFRSPSVTPPRNLCELFLRDVASLLVTSRLLSCSLLLLRPKCEFSRELTETLDSLVTISNAGESYLNPPLSEAGAVLPATGNTLTNVLVLGFFARPPLATTPGVFAAEVTSNLQLLVQHIELKARLAAEEALLVGQNRLSLALLAWWSEWRGCGRRLRAITVRARAQAYVADVGEGESPAPPGS